MSFLARENARRPEGNVGGVAKNGHAKSKGENADPNPIPATPGRLHHPSRQTFSVQTPLKQSTFANQQVHIELVRVFFLHKGGGQNRA